jgi:hypothetical protein
LRRSRKSPDILNLLEFEVLSRGYEQLSLLGHNTVHSVENQPTFLRNILWRADLLLGNDREISNYKTAVSR